MLNRIIVLHTEQRDDHWVFDQQFARWKPGPLSDSQASKVDRLIEQALNRKYCHQGYELVESQALTSWNAITSKPHLSCREELDAPQNSLIVRFLLGCTSQHDPDRVLLR